MADVQVEQSHPGPLGRVRRLPVLRAFGVRIPLVARIALASALLAVLVAAAFAILVITLSNLRDTTTAANRSKDVTSATLVLEQDLLQLDSALRGFVNTGDRRFLRAWRNVRADLPASMTALTRAAAGSEGQERRARQLVGAVRRVPGGLRRADRRHRRVQPGRGARGRRRRRRASTSRGAPTAGERRC